MFFYKQELQFKASPERPDSLHARRADTSALRRRIETDAVSHARQALGSPRLPVRLDLVATGKKAARVT